MGLDMNLSGRKFYWTDWASPKEERRKQGEDGFELKEKILRLGYWRGHPDLHGFIVQTFADGEDECQEIELDKEEIERILAASEAGQLPKTTGFFFGVSQPEDKEETRKILRGALEWLDHKEKGVSRSVVYQASW